MEVKGVMRKTLRRSLLVGGLSLVALAPVGSAVAAAAGPAGSVSASTASVLRDQTRDQLLTRDQLRDGSCQLTASVQRDRDQVRDHLRDRDRLRDGTCLVSERSDHGPATAALGALHRHGGPGPGYWWA